MRQEPLRRIYRIGAHQSVRPLPARCRYFLSFVQREAYGPLCDGGKILFRKSQNAVVMGNDFHTHGNVVGSLLLERGP